MSEVKEMSQIYEIKTYMNDEGMLIKVHVPQESPDVGAFGSLFSKTKIHNDGIGQKITGNIGVRTKQGIRPLEFVFPANYTIRQAFMNFNEEANKAFEEFMKITKEETEKKVKEATELKAKAEAEKSKIIIPKSVIPNSRKQT